MTETTTPAGPLGSEGRSSYARDTLDVIGSIEQSGAGNSILRVGVMRRDDRTWSQTAHVVLSPAERERLIAELVAQRDTAPEVDPELLATIPGAEAYVDMLTVPPITYASTSDDPNDGMSTIDEIEASATSTPYRDATEELMAATAYPGSLFGPVRGLPVDPNPYPVGVIDLSIDDQPCPPMIDPAHWHEVVSAAATGRMTGSRGAKAIVTDPTGEYEYAITFRTKVSDDQWKITSTTPVGDITLRIVS